jgi:hypothetical protein
MQNYNNTQAEEVFEGEDVSPEELEALEAIEASENVDLEASEDIEVIVNPTEDLKDNSEEGISNGTFSNVRECAVHFINKFPKRSNKEVAIMVAHTMNSKTTAACIAWYKNKLKKGLLISGTKAKKETQAELEARIRAEITAEMQAK